MKPTDTAHIQRKRLSGFLLSLLGYGTRGAHLVYDDVSILSRSPRNVPLSQLTRPASLTKKLGFSAVVLSLKGGEEIVVAGVRRSDADAFVSKLNSAWRAYFANAAKSSSKRRPVFGF